MTGRHSRLVASALLLMLIVGALALLATRWATARAEGVADEAARSLARSHAGLLSSELQKFRLLPLVLAEYPDVAAAMAGNAAARSRLDTTLELLAQRTDAAAIYVIARDGRTVAASNWRLPTSFVGQNYAFRPYFTEALRRGGAELFALGTVSGRPGLYLARRVSIDGRPLGVIVVKVEFDAIEANWARSPGISFATDAHGVILVTSVPAWRFETLRTLSPQTLAAVRRTLQFGAAPPRRAPLRVNGAMATVTSDGTRYRVAAVPAPLSDGRLFHLSALDPPLAAARTQALLWASALLIVLILIGGLLFRQAERRRLDERARVALEQEVVRRTAELRDANALLVVESEERREADRRFRAAREELAQANRLGSLGQITAGVAHEINQPVAAIRTFAENGTVLLERGRADDARANLATIVGLTERIGAITGELRNFARRRPRGSGQCRVGDVLDGLSLLLGESTRGTMRVDAPDAVRARQIVGERIRVEQVMVNLVQNALDAVRDRPDPIVVVTARDERDAVALHVRDNGAGVAEAVRDTLFTPFTTGKPNGLGLGLAIAREIAREFGGDLSLADSEEGAHFVLHLRAAA